MPVTLLDADQERRLRAAPLTYPHTYPHGEGDTAPQGYASFSRTSILRSGVDFEEATAALLAWQVQQRAGLRVSVSSLRVELDAVVVLRFGIGPLALSAPCQVVSVTTEADRCGFGYGTLPGHPEAGEESFLLTRTSKGVEFTVSAFSKPASRLAKLGGPVSGAAQRLMTGRYLRTLDR